MLWTLFLVLFTLWLLGVISSYSVGGFIHVLLALAVAALVAQLLLTSPYEEIRSVQRVNGQPAKITPPSSKIKPPHKAA